MDNFENGRILKIKRLSIFLIGIAVTILGYFVSLEDVNILEGLVTIITSPSPLVTDYLVIGGLGAGFATIGGLQALDMEFDPTSLLMVVFVDLVLSGDNAIVIGLAAAALPAALRRTAIVSPDISIELVGRNLLDSSHPESVPEEITTTPTEVEREFYLQTRIRF